MARADGRPPASRSDPPKKRERDRTILHLKAKGFSNRSIAGKLGLDEKAVRRLRNPLHRSHIGQIEAALRLLGKRLEVRVLEAI